MDSLLGSGSMAAVYAVTHRNGARAALKILHPTLCTDEAVCERFLGEGYLTNSVKHAGIVRVLDDGMTDDGCVFLVMDLLEGKTLETLRQDRGGQIELAEILDIADKLMDVLQAVHVGGIIHRDLKPQNVFICDDGSVKLLDFGVARVFDSSARSKLSMFGLVLGTPSFMSPEQALGAREKVDHRSDIWSLGATLFTAITGQTVHLGPHVQAKLLAAATVKARSIALVKQDLPAPIASAIDTALRFKMEERWQSVEAFRRAFREARLMLGLGKPVSVPPPGWLDGPAELDATHPDTGARDADAVVRVGQPPPLPRKKLSEGPGGTFIGIGGPDDAALAVKAARTMPHIPAAPPIAGDVGHAAPPVAGDVGHTATSTAEHGGHGGPPRPRTAGVLPAAIVRAPLGSRPDGQEGSYPAVGSTLKPDQDAGLMAQVGTRRSGGGVWLVGGLLLLAAASGVAFFAVNRPAAGAGDAESAPSAEAPLTSATPVSTDPATPAPSAEPPAPTADPGLPTLELDAKDLVKDAAAAADSPLKASAAAPRTGSAARPPVVRAPKVNPPPTAATEPPETPETPPETPPEIPHEDPPPIPTTLPPDPFGTPD
ncbi:MAG: serine/threonine protein kinase [Labilithrix sp.]|nr:serine/threonine protein kinase [Labilithrix sp.]